MNSINRTFFSKEITLKKKNVFFAFLFNFYLLLNYERIADMNKKLHF